MGLNVKMNDIAIRVENLSKQYRIGGPQARYKTIRALWNRPLLQSLRPRRAQSSRWNMTYSTGLAFSVAAHRSTGGSAGSPCSSRRRLEPEIMLAGAEQHVLN